MMQIYGLKTQWLIKRISYSFYFCLSFSSKKFRHPLFQGAITPAAWLFCEQKRSEQVTVSLVLVKYESTRLDTRHVTITNNSKQVKSVKILTFFQFIQTANPIRINHKNILILCLSEKYGEINHTQMGFRL
jgi:hypothetical protein